MRLLPTTAPGTTIGGDPRTSDDAAPGSSDNPPGGFWMNKKILVAGLGNVFSGDGGFGPAVTFALRERTWPNGVEIVDFGDPDRELAVALTRGLDAVILVDAVARGGKPGTLYVLEEPAPHTAVLELAATLG